MYIIDNMMQNDRRVNPWCKFAMFRKRADGNGQDIKMDILRCVLFLVWDNGVTAFMGGISSWRQCQQLHAAKLERAVDIAV
jgi:hypothetical protein